MENEVETIFLDLIDWICTASPSCNPASRSTRPKHPERRYVSFPVFHPQGLAQCLTQRSNSAGAGLNEEALGQVSVRSRGGVHSNIVDELVINLQVLG